MTSSPCEAAHTCLAAAGPGVDQAGPVAESVSASNSLCNGMTVQLQHRPLQAHLHLSQHAADGAGGLFLQAPAGFCRPAAEFSQQQYEQQQQQLLASPAASPTSSSGAHLAAAQHLQAQQLHQQQLGSPGAPAGGSSGAASPTSASHAAAAAAAAAGACAAGSDGGSGELPPLARELGVSCASLGRLFRADTDAEYEQPVWMVVNLQGKIKGSYTADKMLEFCRRGTLSAAQLVLGIDKNLPYVARQELSFYRTLGGLITAVHEGASYVPLTEAHITSMADTGLTATNWSPLATTSASRAAAAAAADGLVAGLSGLGLGGGGGDACGDDGGSGRAVAAAAAARLRAALQRLCGAGGVARGAGSAPGAKQPLWLYINHLGWCRGPFSGGKVMHAHLCGRLPRNTLVVAYDPEVPACMISGDVGQWFRPLGVLLNNVVNGWSYNVVRWPDVVQRGAFGGGQASSWQPLVYLGPGSPPPLVGADQLAPSPATAVPGAGGPPSFAAAGPHGRGPAAGAGMMPARPQQQQQQQHYGGGGAAGGGHQMLMLMGSGYGPQAQQQQQQHWQWQQPGQAQAFAGAGGFQQQQHEEALMAGVMHQQPYAPASRAMSASGMTPAQQHLLQQHQQQQQQQQAAGNMNSGDYSSLMMLPAASGAGSGGAWVHQQQQPGQQQQQQQQYQAAQMVAPGGAVAAAGAGGGAPGLFYVLSPGGAFGGGAAAQNLACPQEMPAAALQQYQQQQQHYSAPPASVAELAAAAAAATAYLPMPMPTAAGDDSAAVATAASTGMLMLLQQQQQGSPAQQQQQQWLPAPATDYYVGGWARGN